MSDVTPRPWRIDSDENPLDHEMDFWVIDANGREVCTVVSEANARHIVKCVNAHERLVEALSDALAAMVIYEEKVEGEWGMGRSIKEIRTDGDEPMEIEQARALLAELDAAGYRKP